MEAGTERVPPLPAAATMATAALVPPSPCQVVVIVSPCSEEPSASSDCVVPAICPSNTASTSMLSSSSEAGTTAFPATGKAESSTSLSVLTSPPHSANVAVETTTCSISSTNSEATNFPNNAKNGTPSTQHVTRSEPPTSSSSTRIGEATPHSSAETGEASSPSSVKNWQATSPGGVRITMGANPSSARIVPPAARSSVNVETASPVVRIAAIGGVFTRAFDRHNKDLAEVLESLNELHNQLSEVDVEYDDVEAFSEGKKTSLYASIALVKQMLSETQNKFRGMMEDNQLLGRRIDCSLQAAQAQVTELRTELADTHRIVNQLASSGVGGQKSAATSPQEKPKVNGMRRTASDETPAAAATSGPGGGGGGGGSGAPTDTAETLPSTNDTSSSDEEQTYHDRDTLSSMDRERILEVHLSLQSSHQALRQRNRGLRSQVAGLSAAGDALEAETNQLRSKLKASEAEVALTKEALAALKADRKRLKAEKFDLLNQMKQLYQTLEDKERELRDFIRNYEQRIKENDESLRTLAAEREETEREKWNILKHARDEAERSVGLSAELGSKEGQLKQLTDQLHQLRKQLSQLGQYSDHDSVKTSLSAPPPAAAAAGAAAASSSLSPAAVTTPNGRGSSADSGVRVSSDRDSVVAGTSGNLSDSTTSGEAMNGQRGSPTMSPLTLAHSLDAAAMSKSAEQLDSLELLGTRKSRGGGKAPKPGTWDSISRVFSRQKQRKHLHTGLYNNENAWSPLSSVCSSPLTDESYAEKLRLLEEAQQLPMERWKASMVLAWLQVTLGMPQYGPACAENVRSGKVMLELTDSDLDRGLGITHPMHKRKLRLAIEELRQPHLCKFPYISQLNHAWVATEWLPDIGLAQYSEIFSASLTDGRMLAHLTKKDMEKYLNVTRKFHQVSLMHGIQLLRLLQFDRQIICERRQRSELNADDVLVWTNPRFISWARSIDLAEYADNLKDSGVHGALVVLELSFTADTMATAMGIPQSKSMIRRHLAAELDKLVRPARLMLDEEARYARWERERRRPDRTGPGAGRAAGAGNGGSSTLGRSFSRSYASGLQRSSAEKDKRAASLRGSLSRAFGLKVRQEMQQQQQPREPGLMCDPPVRQPPSPPAAPPPPLERPQSVVTTGSSSSASAEKQHHRRVKSISDMETITVTPV